MSIMFRRRLAWQQRHGPMHEIIGQPLPPIPDDWWPPEEDVDGEPALQDDDQFESEWWALYDTADELYFDIRSALREGRRADAERDEQDLHDLLQTMASDYPREYFKDLFNMQQWSTSFAQPMLRRDLFDGPEEEALEAHAAGLDTTVEALIIQAVRAAYDLSLPATASDSDNLAESLSELFE